MSSTPGGSRAVPDGSSSSPPGRPFPIYWSQFPSIKIVRQPKGRFSPQVDERCFTYCSQTVRGRIEQREPWCRTVCLRRVFAHEVARAIAAHDGQKAAVSAKFPLPPEGQHTPDLSDVLTGESPHGERHWEEGYYVWFSTSRWAAQEKMDLMMTDLERQTEWTRYKKHLTEKWEQQERQRNLKGPQPAAVGVEEAPRTEELKPAAAAAALEVMPEFKRPFPDLAGQSILLPIPPPFPPIQGQIQNLLAPTHKVLELTQESLNSGAQWRFAQLIWAKAQTDEPFVLARNVCSRMWEKWKKGPPDESV